MIQWCIVAIPLLLLGAIAIELSHWHTTRIRLSLAIQRAVDQTSLSGGTIEAFKRHLQHQWPNHMTLSIKACIADPIDRLLSDFIDHHLSKTLGQPVIRHDHVRQQHQHNLRRGRPDGRGRRSGKNIFEANILNIEVVARGKALSPWIRQIYDPIELRLRHQAVMQTHRQHGARCTEFAML